MGFYDQRIKELYEKCPRLVILSINSIFHKNHQVDAELVYLDKEQQVENVSKRQFESFPMKAIKRKLQGIVNMKSK